MRIMYHPRAVLPLNCIKYGVLYNNYVIDDIRGIAEAGWHVPTQAEWETLCKYKDPLTTTSSSTAGAAFRETGTSRWTAPNTSATNEYGFSARGAGLRTSTFNNLTLGLYAWSSTTKDSTTKYIAYIGYDDFFNFDSFSELYYGISILLIKDDSNNTGTYTDYDGNVYRTVTIGTQVWMADPLIVTHFSNGDTIPYYGLDNNNNFTNSEWIALITAGMCAYDNDVANVGCDFQFPSVEYADVNYGYLYNWYVSTDVRKVSSSDEWSVFTEEQYQSLITYVGGGTVSGGKLKEVGLSHWETPNTGATDEYGFGLRGNGYRSSLGTFSSRLLSAAHWGYFTPTPVLPVQYNLAIYNTTTSTRGGQNAKYGFAIMLTKPAVGITDGETTTYVGNDGKIYSAICVNEVYWTQNLCETEYRNGDPIVEVTDNATWAALTSGARCAYDNDETNAINP